MIGQSNIYRTLFEKINDGILILSADGSILESNDAAENPRQQIHTRAEFVTRLVIRY
ncbi:MAG: hypothetical protein AAF490_21440 [Chloroflexota bacterium]